jgi:RNA polymerase sigma-70 factor (sigma-E family)
MQFDEYVRAQRPALLRFATVLTGRTWLAEDVVSDVLGRAYERWDGIAAMSRPHAYVRRMVVNEYLSWQRRLRHRSRAGSDLEEHVEPVTDGVAERAERDAMIARLDRLPRKQRAAVVLRYYAGLSDAEIAAALGCRPCTVRSQISRALAALRIDIAEQPDGAEQPDHPPGRPADTRPSAEILELR